MVVKCFKNINLQGSNRKKQIVAPIFKHIIFFWIYCSKYIIWYSFIYINIEKIIKIDIW